MANLGVQYHEDPVFEEINNYFDFYKGLSFTVMNWVTTGTSAYLNIDTYIFSSMQGTIDSIRIVLDNGRINDAYSLLRKYYDSVIINIYSILYLQDEVSLDNFIVEKINNWLKGKEQMPEYRIMSQYIRSSPKLKVITDVIYQDDRYKKIRDRCNDHTHYNFYYNVLLNDNELHLPKRLDALQQFGEDIREVFILHFSYLFYLNEHYMSSTDHIDALDFGFTSEEGSQYWVAPFIQDTFTNVINKHRPDIGKLILQSTSMKLK